MNKFFGLFSRQNLPVIAFFIFIIFTLKFLLFPTAMTDAIAYLAGTLLIGLIFFLDRYTDHYRQNIEERLALQVNEINQALSFLQNDYKQLFNSLDKKIEIHSKDGEGLVSRLRTETIEEFKKVDLELKSVRQSVEMVKMISGVNKSRPEQTRATNEVKKRLF